MAALPMLSYGTFLHCFQADLLITQRNITTLMLSIKFSIVNDALKVFSAGCLRETVEHDSLNDMILLI